MEISFYHRNQHGMEIYISSDSDKFSIIKLDDKYYIRIKNPKQEWIYPTWNGNKFKTFDETQSWLSLHDWKNADDDHIEYDDSVFINMTFIALSDRQAVLAAINTRNLANNLSRVHSSNVWAYGIDVQNRKDKTGDVIVQFKAKNGGAGDIYIYYDVPKTIFNRWLTAPSKGHYFWVYIRNNFNYSKLTGDKIGKLKNAINHYGEADIKSMENCQFILKFVDEYVRQIIDRTTFEEELPEYFSMCKNDMSGESKTLTDKFKTNIVDVVEKKKDYSDDALRALIQQNIREIRKMLP